jgi:RimJ/RimL family protein N-acetyltransferase
MLLREPVKVSAGQSALELRSLSERDVTPAWISWFGDPDTQRFIAAARQPCTLETQRAYVRATTDSAHNLLVGLVDSCGQLWATSGVQGVGLEFPSGPWMGCLVDPARRGQGVGRTLISEVRNALVRECGCPAVYAGISSDNPRSAATFAACGFRRMPDRPDGSMVMCWSRESADSQGKTP